VNAPEGICGEKHDHKTCVRPAGHKGGHLDRDGSYWQPEEAAAPEPGRHFPSGHFTDVTGGHGGPSRHQCRGCEAPVTHERGEWRSVYTGSMWCPAGAR